MINAKPILLTRLMIISFLLLMVLVAVMLLGISVGPTQSTMRNVLQTIFGMHASDAMLNTIIWKIRFPRVLLSALVGAALSLGGLVFQALLRNPLAEPYILGISGGSAIGAIIGILMGFSRFPGVSLTAFTGSIATLVLILAMSSGQTILKKDALLLSGVMVNAFCAAVIMFLISMTQDTRLHNIIFWLMGDLSLGDMRQVGILAVILLPCFVLVFWLSNPMNLLLMGKELAQTMGVNIKLITVTLLVATSFMVSATVSYCGLVGFVGLVMPHLLRLVFGPDHRILVPACVLGGGTYLVVCDILARTLPKQGEIPAGVITAMIGAPLFIYLLKRTAK
ncbi:MAG: iron ABC transporter permease [Desulfobacterales bacterium]|jgi:iron complex transport system permease protein|nr:iron ABC transporter permease [Desulfobacterales bacterium]